MFLDENLFLLLLIIQVLGVIILLAIGWRLRNLIRQYRRLLTGKGEINLEEVLMSLGERTKRLEERLSLVEEELARNREEALGYLQKWSLMRYKAFANTGGEQSFSLVILDRKGDGVVLSSIYGREESRVYAKAIKNGKSSYPLSEEEEQVLARALSNKSEKN
ncbi:MAG: DUF4446 family protein [Firmicutes bacterium]|jgi:hypothetical protein|nr:DUF4446 family protein [Bacillota bacterium]